jgi:hypothetical protein
MSKLIVVALLAVFPALAGAVPVFVTYEATVTSVTADCQCGSLGYHEGDRLARTVEMVTDGLVRLPSRPEYGLWGAPNGADFIFGRGTEQGQAPGADQVFVADAAAWGPAERAEDIYEIMDHARLSGGGDELLTLRASSFAVDFIHDVGPVQTFFDSRALEHEGPAEFLASLTGHLRGMSYSVGLRLERLMVSPGIPGQCRR